MAETMSASEGQFKRALAKKTKEAQGNFTENKLSEQDRELLHYFAAGIASAVSTDVGKLNVLWKGAQLGWKLRRAISNSRFDGIPFLMVMVMSVMKDFADVIAVELGLAGTLINIFVAAGLFVFFLGRGTFFRKMALKKAIIPIIIEFIPFINMLPMYTILTLWLRHSINNKIIRLEANVVDLEQRMKKIK